ncbi:MAG: SDR family NAD(P)-dependent oxidoreductase [Magnetococcales bacterium]|nr:SDR family NAD(P)-dependent oxidoreductase [Magnetococcales bacterium]
MRTVDQTSRTDRQGLGNVWAGFKVAIALMLGWPFIVVLLPMWLVYSWNERRLGRPAPYAPWSVVGQALRRGRQRGAEPQRSVPVRAGPVFSWNQELSPGSATARSAADFEPAPSTIDGQPSSGVALVTGGDGRLGAAIGLELARRGWDVGVVYYREREFAERTVETIAHAGGVAHAFRLDPADPSGAQTLLDETSRLWGRGPGLLVNHAGLFLPAGIHGGSWNELNALLQMNLQGPLWLSLCAAQRMLGQGGGQIVTLCDVWGERPLAGYTAYSAAMSGMLMATQALARDLAPEVRVNAIALGGIPFFTFNGGDAPDGGVQDARSLLAEPSGTSKEEEAVILALRYLLSARELTGELLRVAGGESRLG